MIAQVIRWSGRNLFLILLLTLILAISGIFAIRHVPLDAVPDISDTQVIVYTEYQGQAPQIVEDQVTFPLTTALLSVPGSRAVRGFSYFGVSFVYVIFEDGTDLYWARSRVLEYLSTVSRQLPPGVEPSLGPDATGVGWIYQYVLRDPDRSLDSLRTIQDWNVRFGLSKATGVSEVASIGGFVRQYSVTVDPRRLQSLGVPLSRVRDVIRDSNLDAGGRTVELAETEFVVRGRGYVSKLRDLENAVVRNDGTSPLLLKDVARVELVPDERRGLSDFNGLGETVSGIVVQRFGSNTLTAIESTKKRLEEIKPSLPKGVTIEPVYDRSELIYRAVRTLTRTLIEEGVFVALICFIFLAHARSALVAILTLPIGVLIAYILMYATGTTSNIMTLGGIAIAIGAMVDAAIVMIENVHKRLERLPAGVSRIHAITDAAVEVGPSLFFSLLIITISFVPILALQDQEGRMFKPLAYTKTFAMAGAALLSVTLVPALMVAFIQGKIRPEGENPVNRVLMRVYRPLVEAALRYKRFVILAAAGFVLVSIWPATQLGSEFIPTLNEGALFYMPTTLPGISLTKAAELLQKQDAIFKSFPEVATVWGKAGRATTATDPAPTEMFETIITLKPEDEWPSGMTTDKLVQEMDAALQFPGVSNSWSTPIRGRIDMLSTGIKTPVGVKVFGNSLDEIEKVAEDVEAAIKSVPGTSSAYAERLTGGYYLNIDPNREQLARFGLNVADVQSVVAAALGAEPISTIIMGRERYTVTLRYPRGIRSDPQSIASETLIPLPGGKGTVALKEVAKVSLGRGPSSIRTEDARPVIYVYVDMRGRDLGSYVEDAQKAVASKVKFPPGSYVTWSGQFEGLERAKDRLTLILPLVLLSIFLLLYLNFRSIADSLIVLLSVPFALTGGLWLMWALGYNLSVGTVIGFIALAGVSAETGVVMLLYLNNAYRERRQKRAASGLPFTSEDLKAAIVVGAAGRLRPKTMTVCAIIFGLLPIMWENGAGSEVMQRIAVPVIGGMISSTILTLLVIPVIFAAVKEAGLRKHRRVSESARLETAGSRVEL